MIHSVQFTCVLDTNVIYPIVSYNVKKSPGMKAFEYTVKFVAFSDILGWKDLVEKSAKDVNLMQTIGLLSNAQNGMCNISSANGVRHIRMSDASVIIAEPSDFIQVHTLLTAVHSIHTTSLLHGFLARGGIKLGKIYFDDNNPVILGPALTEAYEYENKYAFYPRTIIDDEAAAKIKMLFSQQDQNELIKLYPKTHGLPISKDIDGLYFVNYLGGFMDSPHIEFARERIINTLTGNLNPSVRQKYSWLMNYFNSMHPNKRITEEEIVKRINSL